MVSEPENKNPQEQKPAAANVAEAYCNIEKEYTYDDMMNDDDAERNKVANPKYEKPKSKTPDDGNKSKSGIFTSTYTFLRTSKTGKAICATAIAMAIAAGSTIYGARNASQVNSTLDGTVGRVSHTMQASAGALTDRVDYVLNGNPQIDEFLEKKKGEYEAVLKSEPTNKEAQKELTKLEALIGAYKQIYHIKE